MGRLVNLVPVHDLFHFPISLTKGFKSTGSVCKILNWLRVWKLKEGRMIIAVIFVGLLGSWHECKELVWEACLGCIKKNQEKVDGKYAPV